MKAPALARPKSAGPKPRVRATKDGSFYVTDSFENLLNRTGVGAGNIGQAGNYGFNPVSRNRLRLEWAYRGSWLVGMIVDCVAEDMTREGVELVCDAAPDELQQFDQEQIQRYQVWTALCQTIKLARLYGGAVGYIMIDGQQPETPLDPTTVGKDAFRGIFPLDRWMLFPQINPDNLVMEMGPELGMPATYEVRPDYGTGLPMMKLHHTRLIRLDGVWLPYWQRIAENLWGQSVVERLWDRLIAFDSGTSGASQLLYQARLRTYQIKDLRKLVAAGGPAFDGVVKQLDLIRKYQSNEGMTILDADDKFETHNYGFEGIDDVLLQLGQQLSGASQIPLVRLFGQSPAGLNATGESDLRTYYDNIKRQQNATLLAGVRKVYHVAWRSQNGKDPPKGWSLQFRPLWQMDDEQRAAVADQTTTAIMAPFTAGVTARSTTLKELKQSGKVTGMWTNITDEMINEAVADDDEKPPDPTELGLTGEEAAPGAAKKPNGQAKNGAGGAPVRKTADAAGAECGEPH